MLYPGDVGGDKAASRLLLYQLAKTIPIQGHAITLAGTIPEHEIVLMRDYLRWPASKTWFIDNSKSSAVLKALMKVRTLWPGVNVSRDDIRDVIPDIIPNIGFANLDLMGFPLSDLSVECIKRLSKSMLPGAIFGLTWIKGREIMTVHKSAQLLWRMGAGFRGNERRWAGLERAVSKLSSGSLQLTNRWEYFNNHSPMCVAVFAKSSQQ